jgi:hypothetical protein
MEYFCSGCAIILMVKMLKDDSKHINAINTLIRQTSRWAIASENDDNPVIRLLHANYAAGYLYALKSIASQNEIEETAGIKLDEFQSQIVKIQDTAHSIMAKKCPNIVPDPKYLTDIAWQTTK